MKNLWLNPSLHGVNAPQIVVADRDGTLIRHVDYLSDPAGVALLPGVREAVEDLVSRKIPFFIHTNQSGVGRGLFPIERAHACQTRLMELLGMAPRDLSGWCIAPEAPGHEGGYRKPSPRFIDEIRQHCAAPDAVVHVVGDTRVDWELAWNSGASAWAVRSGKTGSVEHESAHSERTPLRSVAGFAQAVAEIIG